MGGASARRINTRHFSRREREGKFPIVSHYRFNLEPLSNSMTNHNQVMDDYLCDVQWLVLFVFFPLPPPPPSSLFLYFSAKFPFQLNSCIQLRCCPVRMTRVTWIVTWHDQIAICSFYLSFSSFSLFRRHWMLMHIISFQLAGVSLPPFPPINFLWLFLIVVVVVVSSSMNTNRNDRD